MSIFGATNPAPPTGASIFGSTQHQPSSNPLFGTPQNQQTPSLFGSTNPFQQSQHQQQPQQSSGSLFGNTNSTQSHPTNSIFGNTNTGGSLFGATNQQQQPTGGTSLFGSTLGTGRGLFGSMQSQQQQPGATPSLFGSTTTQPSTTGGGGIFGNTQNQQQQPTAGSSLFGNTSTQPATSGGLFGSTNTNQPSTGGSLFGGTTATQPSTGGGLFGSTNTNQPSTGGGLFGSTNTNQPSTGGGLFGSTNQPQTGGGLFGNTSTANTQPSTGLFGASTATNQPSNVFGTSNTNGQQSSLFGGNRPGGIFGSSTAGTGGSLFGTQNQNQQPQQQQQQPSLFGSTNAAQPSTGLFGSSSSTNTGGGLFGSKPQQSATGSLFGSTTGTGAGLNASTFPSSSLLGSRTALTPAQQQADAQTQALQLQQRIEAIYHAWNPSSPQCRFQHYFYNLVSPERVGFYGRPANALNDALWEKARRENPDPTCHVPVLAIGFDDLRTRVEAQNKKSNEHQQYLKELKTRLELLSTQHTLSNSSRLLKAVLAQTQLTQRLLKFVQHLHLLIPSVRSSSIRPEEEQLRSSLEELEEELRRGRMKGKLNELWALLGAVNASKERTRVGVGEWAVVDEEGLAQLTQILADQQAGLSHLTKILQKVLKDVSIIMGTSSNTAQSDYEVDNLLSSTDTFRASALR